MKVKKNKIRPLAMIILVTGISMFYGSCSNVKAYSMQKINDSDMELSSRSVEQFETAFHTYREGSAGANGGKTGGGCGCN